MPSSLGNSYADVDDLMNQWTLFAVANGYTRQFFNPTTSDGPAFDEGFTALNKVLAGGGLMFGSWRWTISGQRLFHFQALSNPVGAVPGTGLDDAGPGGLSGVDRATIIANGPGTADFFQGSENGQEFLVCIAETNPDLFRFWSLGELIKVGTWTGGEFLANQSWPAHTSISASQDAPFDTRNEMMFDALGNVGGQGTTVRIQGVHAQGGSTKWGECRGSGGAGVDRGGIARSFLEGASREGPWFNSMNGFVANPINGFVPLAPWPIHYREGSSWTLMGFVPGMRGLNITFITPREEFTLGADTWKAYPWTKKSTALAGGPESGNEGWAVLKTP